METLYCALILQAISLWLTEYKTKEEIKANYSKEDAKNILKGFYLEYEGVKYYQCEYSPYNTENMELLSDLSDLEYFDNEVSF